MQNSELCFGLCPSLLETGSGRAYIFLQSSRLGRAGPKFFGPGLIFLARAGL